MQALWIEARPLEDAYTKVDSISFPCFRLLLLLALLP